MKQKIYVVEFQGQKQKHYFQTKQQAEDYGIIVGGFGGKKYRVYAIFVEQKEVVK